MKCFDRTQPVLWKHLSSSCGLILWVSSRYQNLHSNIVVWWYFSDGNVEWRIKILYLGECHFVSSTFAGVFFCLLYYISSETVATSRLMNMVLVDNVEKPRKNLNQEIDLTCNQTRSRCMRGNSEPYRFLYVTHAARALQTHDLSGEGIKL